METVGTELGSRQTSGDYTSDARSRKQGDMTLTRENSRQTEDGGEPSEEEKKSLRKVPGTIPKVSWVIGFAEFAERASYFGASQIFSNFIMFPLPDGGPGSGAVAKGDSEGHSGALNMGLQAATAFVLLFYFLAFVFPILGAYLADVYLGRIKTIMIGVIIGGIAHVIMVGGAAPAVLRAGNGVAPFLVSFFLLAFGSGIYTPNVSPAMIDQYTNQKQIVKTLKSGERVIVDPELTIQRVMLLLYAMINIGGFLAIASTYEEKFVGYWLAFLVPGIVYLLLPIALLSVYKKLVIKKPQGSELTNFLRILWITLKRNSFRLWAHDFWDAALPAKLAERGIEVPWTDRAVLDVRRTAEACLVFLYFPVYILNDNGIGSVSANQGAAMTSKGAPSDLLGNFNPLVIVVFAPILSFGLYPLLNHLGIRFGPIRRMTFGFLLATLSGVIGAIVQWKIYKTSPCGFQASTCDDVSPISIWWQVPNVALGAVSELFCQATAYEMAYVRSPPHLKSVVISIFLFITALSAALGEILLPAIVDPHLIWVWAGPAIALFVQTIIFWIRHHKLDDEAYLLDQDTPTQSVENLINTTGQGNTDGGSPQRDLEKHAGSVAK